MAENQILHDNIGWTRKVLTWEWHAISICRWPNWDKDGEAPPSFLISVKVNIDKSSRDIAIEIDDYCKGLFYYRDWTNSGLPFVDDGEIYQSRFWFQFRSDKEKFEKQFKSEVRDADSSHV